MRALILALKVYSCIQGRWRPRVSLPTVGPSSKISGRHLDASFVGLEVDGLELREGVELIVEGLPGTLHVELGG